MTKTEANAMAMAVKQQLGDNPAAAKLVSVVREDRGSDKDEWRVAIRGRWYPDDYATYQTDAQITDSLEHRARVKIGLHASLSLSS